MTLDMLRARRVPTTVHAHAGSRAGRMEDRHVLGFSRRVDRRRLRALRAGRCGSAISTAAAIPRSSACRPPRRCSSASSMRSPRRTRSSSSRIPAAAATGTRRGLQRIGRSAERRVPADVQHLVHPGRLADPRQPGSSARVDRHAHRRAGVPALRSRAHAQRSVRVLAERSAAAVRAGRHAAAPPAAAGAIASATCRAARRRSITSPVTAATYTVRARASAARSIPLAANADSEVRRLHWFVDESYVGTGAPGIAIGWNPRSRADFIVAHGGRSRPRRQRELDVAAGEIENREVPSRSVSG